MLVQLTPFWLIAGNVLAWLGIHLAAAWLGIQLPAHVFRRDGWLCRERAFERGGRLYESALGVRRWKGMLPDGAAIFKGGFRKKKLSGGDPAYLDRFVQETCRGEAVHWVVFASALMFFLWNPWWIGLIMIGYAAVANLPCVVAQRYNRIRLLRTLQRGGRSRFSQAQP